MSCCGGNCGCGANCACGTNCGGCKAFPEKIVGASTACDMEYNEGGESGCKCSGGCKCGDNCTCNPCNCK